MADKITTLKTKTGDNVYPNIKGDNRKDSFANSTTIKHYFYDKTHKVGFQLANETNNKIINSLQKPAGLTKTELVGVGTNGQENIEIGDNLTLANGKLSATGGGSGAEINILVGTIISTSGGIVQGTYTGNLDINKINILFLAPLSNSYILLSTLNVNDDYIQGSATLYAGVNQLEISVAKNEFYIRSSPYYTHFLTLTYSSNNASIYLTIQNTSEEQFTAETLASYLAGKKVLANGNLNGNVPTYIAGEGGSIKMYYRTAGDSNINQEPDVYSDLSSFAISDLVTPVE